MQAPAPARSSVRRPFLLGMAAGLALTGLAAVGAILVLSRGIGAGGVGVQPIPFLVTIQNNRDAEATVEIVERAGVYSVSEGSQEFRLPGPRGGADAPIPPRHVLQPHASLTIIGMTVDLEGDMYQGVVLLFAASGTYDGQIVTTAVDQPTGMIEFKDGQWLVVLEDDAATGRLQANIRNKVP